MITPHLRIGDVLDDGWIVVGMRVHPMTRKLMAQTMRDVPGVVVMAETSARGVAVAASRNLVAASRCWMRLQMEYVGHFNRARLARTRAIWGKSLTRCQRNAQRIYDIHRHAELRAA